MYISNIQTKVERMKLRSILGNKYDVGENHKFCNVIVSFDDNDDVFLNESDIINNYRKEETWNSKIWNGVDKNKKVFDSLDVKKI